MIAVSNLIAIIGISCVCATFIITIFVTYTKATNWLGEKFQDITVTLAMHTQELRSHSERMDRYEERYIQIANRMQRILGRMDYDRRHAKDINGVEEDKEP